MSEERKDQLLVHFRLPRYEAEIRGLVTETIDLLVSRPERLGDFLDLVKDNLYLAEVGGNENLSKLVSKYASEIAKGVDGYDWSKRRNFNLTFKAAKELMRVLPEEDKKEVTPTEADLDAVAVSMMKGFLEKRYEKDHDWRGAIETRSKIISAAVAGGPTSGLYQKVHDLMMGKYSGLMEVGGLGWKAVFVAARVVSVEDEKYLSMADQSGRAWSLMAEMVGKLKEFDARSESYDLLGMKFDAMANMLIIGKDPDTIEGREEYQKVLRIMVMIENKNRTGDGRLDAKKLMEMQIPAEILEVVMQYRKYPERGESLFALNSKTSEDKLGTSITEMGPVVPGVFPFTVVGKRSLDVETLADQLGDTQMREKMRMIAEKVAVEGGRNWIVVPFALFDLKGYLVGGQEVTGIKLESSAGNQAKAAISFLRTLNLEEIRKQRGKEDINTYYGNGFELILTPDKYTPKSPEESALDVSVPDIVRSRSIEVLGGVVKMRMAIPKEFTQMPTKSGYVFPLENHQDLPEVFREAILRQNESGGISVQLNLLGLEGVILKEGLRPITAIITFPSNRVKVEWDDTGMKFPMDLQWILESVVLNITRSASCIPLNENEQPRVGGIVSEEGEEGRNSIPGRVGHVGGFRLSGERKQFTSIAEGKFKEAMKLMDIATGGLLLAEINLEHHRQEPECKRSLTWYSGYEPEVPPAPVVRRPPERLVSLSA